MKQITHLDLFSGIGGFSLAADNVWGKENVKHIFVENDEFCQQVLKKHWKEAPIFGDIRDVAYSDISRYIYRKPEKQSAKTHKQTQREPIAGIRSPILLTGGFPCQPFSQAGKRKGTEDPRNLWPEMLRVIRDVSPKWVVAENVRGLTNWNDGVVFEQIHIDLEASGYEVQSFILPAVAVNAPHRRDRIWIVGYSKSGAKQTEQKVCRGEGSNCTRSVRNAPNTRRKRRKQGNDERVEAKTPKRTPRPADAKRQDKDDTNANGERLERGNKKGKRQRRQLNRNGSNQRWNWEHHWIEVAAKLCGVDARISAGVDRPEYTISAPKHRNKRIEALGNAIVPAVAEQIFKAIKEYEE